MTFKFERYVKEELTSKSLRDVLKNAGLPYSYDQSMLLEKIEAEVNKENPEIMSVEIESLIKDSIKYGSRRMLYISKFSRADSRKISSRKVLSKALNFLTDTKSIEDFNLFNNPENNIPPKDENIDSLEYLHTEFNKMGEVEKVEFCFTYFYKLPTEHKDGTRTFTTYKAYVWIELFVQKQTICFRLHQPNEAFGTTHTANTIFNTYSDKIYKAFGINKLEMTDYDSVLYKVFKDIIDVSEKPFKDKISANLHILPRIMGIIKEEELFRMNSSVVFFKERIQDLLERTVIQENFSQYLAYAEGKDGVISKMLFTDETGATVSASSGTKKGDTLELSDIFFDTRKTINDNERINTLWIDWFKSKNTKEISKEPGRITTKFNTGKDHFTIHFQRILLTEELESYVFSKLGKYGEFGWHN